MITKFNEVYAVNDLFTTPLIIEYNQHKDIEDFIIRSNFKVNVTAILQQMNYNWWFYKVDFDEAEPTV